VHHLQYIDYIKTLKNVFNSDDIQLYKVDNQFYKESDAIMKRLFIRDNLHKLYHCREDSSKSYNDIHDIPLPDNIDYLREGIEIQARLHEIMVAGYGLWGELPNNRKELWAALVSSGIWRVPDEVDIVLDSLSKESKAYSVYYSARNKEVSTEAKNEIMTVNQSLSKYGSSIFWLETLPELYANLIEMYGDKLGKQRFGLENDTNKRFQSIFS